MYTLIDYEVRLEHYKDLLKEAQQYRLVKQAEAGNQYSSMPAPRVSRLNGLRRIALGWLSSALTYLSPGLACRLNLSPC
jgi:hypothetical protein